MYGNKDAIAIQDIGNTPLAVRSLKFEPVGGTHELKVLLFQLTFKPTPIVAGLRIVRFIIDGAHHIGSRENDDQLLQQDENPAGLGY